MDALVITFREGIEAVLVIGIVLAVLKRAGHVQSVRPVIAGVIAALVFSAGAAVVLSTLGLEAERPAVEGALFLVAALAVAGMVWWMVRTGREMRSGIESKLDSILGRGANTRVAALSLFAFSFFMVAREGVEMVLFLAALAVGKGASATLLAGGVVGLLLAVVYGVLFMRGSAHIDLRLFFSLTAIVLGLLALKLLGSSIHEFEEAGLIPMSESVAHAFDWIAGSSSLDWLFLIALTLPMLMPWYRHRAAGRAADAVGS